MFTKKKKQWSKEIIIDELRPLVARLGRFPLDRELRLSGMSTLAAKMSEFGRDDIRSSLGFPRWRRPIGYWQSWDNLEKEINMAFPDLLKKGLFPSSTLLVKKLHCQPAIDRFGGIAEVARRMGFTASRMLIAPDGHHVRSSYEYVFDAYLSTKGISHEVDINVPSTPYRADFKIGDIFVEIWGFSGNGYENKKKDKLKAYKELNMRLLSLNGSFFNRSTAKVFSDLDRLMEANGITPTKEPQEITIAIKANGYWNFERTIQELQNVSDQIGHLPTFTYLNKTGRSDLCHAIQRNGGMYYMTKFITGHQCSETRPKGYWSCERVLCQMQHVVDEMKAVPTYRIVRLAIKRNIVDRGLIAAKFELKMNMDEIRSKLRIPQAMQDEFVSNPRQHYLNVKARYS